MQAISEVAKDGHYYDGRVHDRFGKKLYSIFFDDGEFRAVTPENQIRLPQELSSDVCYDCLISVDVLGGGADD